MWQDATCVVGSGAKRIFSSFPLYL